MRTLRSHSRLLVLFGALLWLAALGASALRAELTEE